MKLLNYYIHLLLSYLYMIQISIHVINNMPEPGRNLAADACMAHAGRTRLSPCIISVLGQSVPTGLPCQHDIFSRWATYIQIFFGYIHNIVTTTVTNSTGVEPVSYIYINKPTCCQNNPAESFLWMHLHQFQYLSCCITHSLPWHSQGFLRWFYCPGIARAFSDGFIFASSL